MGLPLERFPDWPAAMDWDMALAYTQLSNAELRRQVASGQVKFVLGGANGKRLARREQLDEMLREIWSTRVGLPSEDMGFGDD